MELPPTTAPPDHHGPRPKIVVVDNDPSICEMLSLILGVDFDVLTASTGTAALELVAVREPDLIILSLLLSDMDGYEVCRRLRLFSTVPVLLLTPISGAEAERKAREAGVDDCCVTMPFSPRDLVARSRALLRRSEAH